MRNPLISRSLKLAGALLLLGAMSSCLLPQEDNPLPDPPVVEDHRPLIILTRVTPPPPQGSDGVNVGNPVYTTVVGPTPPNCITPQFAVYVSDEDLKDPINSAWRATTVDGRGASNWLKGTTQGSTPEGTTAVRPNARVPPPELLASAPFATAGNVRIDVVVADTPIHTTLDVMGNVVLEEDSYTTLPLADGGSVDEPAGVDSYTWDVTVVQCQ